MFEQGLSVLTAVSLATLLVLCFFRGRFWRADQRLPQQTADCKRWPMVTAVIPARNEAATIGEAVASLVGQNYEGPFNVIVVDDGSADGTGQLAKEAGVQSDAVTVIEGQPLPLGWTGKLWAQSQGLSHGAEQWPETEYWLLTDADISHDPSVLKRLVAKAQTDGLDLVSLMVRLHCGNFWERLLVPAFVFFFQKLYPFPRVNNPARPEAAAAGGCMLVRRSALTAVGGMESIRDKLIDDCALAQRIGGHRPLWLGLATKTRSIRAYQGLSELWAMVARTAFTQLGHSTTLLIATVIAMSVVYCVPPVATAYGFISGNFWIAAGGGLAWFVMSAMFWPTLRLYRQSIWWGLMLPLAAFLYTLMTVDSARMHWRGQGGLWKGRSYGGT